MIASFRGSGFPWSIMNLLPWRGFPTAGEEPLFVRDLTGDGRAEVLVWGPGIREAVLLRLD